MYPGQINPEHLVFIDETWTKTNEAPLRGWAPRGTRLVPLAQSAAGDAAQPLEAAPITLAVALAACAASGQATALRQKWSRGQKCPTTAASHRRAS
jgi:hypothetical protein